MLTRFPFDRLFYRYGFLISGALAVFTLLLYLQVNRDPLTGAPVMPVDDAYIHFQYARQLAEGEGYAYNTGLGDTSGATSLLYPYLLAGGYRLGFQSLNLGMWAMLIGTVCLAFSGWSVTLLARHFGVGVWLSLFAGVAVQISGVMTWHAFSGMETPLVVAFTLITLYLFASQRFFAFIAAACVMALLRPELSVMSAAASMLYGVRLLLTRQQRPIHALVFLPVLAAGMQPLLNLILTGSLSASGNQAKSVLGMIPFYPDVVLSRLLENFVRIWTEFFSGAGEFGVWYLAPLSGAAALVGWGVLITARQHRWTALLIAGWLLMLAAAVSTLDTAFWHFKRYQMPLLVLAIPLAVVCLRLLRWRVLQITGTAYLLVASVLTLVNFLDYSRMNTESVRAQPLAMAYWLRENTPLDAVIAVHDVGMMRYIGERTTLDMVGLTTPDAADYWRNGPGSVAEFLMRARPDYIAAYVDARGLNYLADTRIYGAPLASFQAEYDPRFNVALGAPFQGIYRPNWSGLSTSAGPHQQTTLDDLAGFTPVDSVNVADLDSERAHDYTWQNVRHEPGFATEVYDMAYIGQAEKLLDAGRRMTGEESFTLAARAGEDALLVTRVHAVSGGVLDIYVNEVPVGQRWLFPAPGEWLELVTLIPAEVITSDQIAVSVRPRLTGGHYMPYYHWLYQGELSPYTPIETLLASFQDGAVVLEAIDYAIDSENRLTVNLTWATDGRAQGDYVRFIHVYDDWNAPPIAQSDQRPAGGTLPPGNWLPSTLQEQVVVELGEIQAGNYRIAVGFYDPQTFERLAVTVYSPNLSIDGAADRLVVGELTIGG